jgi:hypothetical protein
MQYKLFNCHINKQKCHHIRASADRNLKQKGKKSFTKNSKIYTLFVSNLHTTANTEEKKSILSQIH